MISVYDSVGPVVRAIQGRLSGEVSSTHTPYTALAAYIPALYAGDFLVVAGRPSMGKTAFALNMAWKLASAGHKIIFFSLEMSIEQLTVRLLSSILKVSSQDIQHSKDFNWSEHRKMVMSQKEGLSNFLIDDTSILTPRMLRERVQQVTESGVLLGGVFVDYLQLMKVPNQDQREREIAECSQTMKAVAKDYKAPVFALSQLNRSVESRSNRRPVLSDLRDSGSIEQDADAVLFIYRDEYYYADAVPGETEVIIAKHRNGPTGVCKLHFDASTTTFSDRGAK